MKTIILLFILMNSSFAFLWFDEDVKVHPRTLKTDTERMNYLKKHNPDLFLDMSKSGSMTPSKRKVWDKYIEESNKPYDPLAEEKAKQKRIQDLKDAAQRKNDELEAKLKQGYRLINGELISREEQEKIKQDKLNKEKEMERVVEFYEEMDIELPKNSKDVKVKDE